MHCILHIADEDILLIRSIIRLNKPTSENTVEEY